MLFCSTLIDALCGDKRSFAPINKPCPAAVTLTLVTNTVNTKVFCQPPLTCRVFMPIWSRPSRLYVHLMRLDHRNVSK